ncbi:PIN domain-containing protein [Gloeocapsopsis dulcis]|uniref:PIN domain-containing protein n=1 Tax=Gloeocapsopsis dulcis AAB1 = 1H9 TaxID=1433147 RepID=A0A6N8G279_9CHRO|nr:PIN domain-containing protein [Gloeocapsopsis dulcis]MUL39074.1 hypothetical protein [Gloeocapsopsis dulcis AAB1 = 1H9]WNN92134.1 hypothetical protein P0S91_26495 [Gloeocapsopsis dulcis]
MNVLVSDTSVLVDLERGGLLEATFSLPVTMAVPDLLYAQELSNYNGERLLNLGLQILELDDQGVEMAINYREQVRAISLPDSFALVLAKTSGFTLLTGDGALRNLAAKEQVECHGVLWILDFLEQEQVIAIANLYAGLNKIANHPRCRLPTHEVTIRLSRYTRQN